MKKVHLLWVLLGLLIMTTGSTVERTLLFTQNHNEGYDIWGKDQTGFLEFSRLLEEEGFTITAMNQGELGAEDLLGVDAVIVSYPEDEFTQGEIDALYAYVHRGGSLMVFGGKDVINQTNGIISRYGIDITDRMVVVDGIMYLTMRPSSSTHPIFTFVTTFEQIITPAVKVHEGPGELCYAGDDPVYGMEEDEGFIAIKEVGEGRVLVTGDADFLNNVFLYDHDNAQIGVNMVSYMTGRPIEEIGRSKGYRWPVIGAVAVIVAAGAFWSSRWKRSR